MATANLFAPSEKLTSFLDTVEKGKYDRQITAGISKFVDGKVDDDMKGFYSDAELKALVDLNGTDRAVDACR